MPTEPSATLFLFAHQDDEFGVFAAIQAAAQRGRVLCAYLTDGAAGGVHPAQRNAESLAVLAQLGVPGQDVAFAGEALGIGDGRLLEHLPEAAAWIEHWIASAGPVEAIYVTAWEGGHHDHDALHAIVVHVAARAALLGCVRQFPLYHGFRMPHPLFRVLAPLPMNGTARRMPLAPGERLRELRLCLSYPSQRNSWLGLFPFVLLHHLFRGHAVWQPVALDRIEQPPHPGRLYYERRGFCEWPLLHARLQAWRKDYARTISPNS